MNFLNKLSAEQIARLPTDRAALKILTSSASHASTSLDKFASWFLSAFGAGLTLLLSNYKDLVELVPISQLREAASLFVCAVIFGVAQKYLAAIVSAMAAAAKDGDEIGKESPNLDFDHYVHSVRSALPPPIRFFANSMFKKLEHGEFLIGGKFIQWLVLIQGLMLLLQSVELVRALAKIFPS
jgi:hypothetical protein